MLTTFYRPLIRPLEASEFDGSFDQPWELQQIKLPSAPRLNHCTKGCSGVGPRLSLTNGFGDGAACRERFPPDNSRHLSLENAILTTQEDSVYSVESPSNYRQ